MLSKLSRIVAVARRDPSEASVRLCQYFGRLFDRICVSRSRWVHELTPVDNVLTRLYEYAPSYLPQEHLLREIDKISRMLEDRIASATTAQSFGAENNADLRLATLCYAVCRLFAPSCVIETGVGYGVTTTAFLAALERGGHGELHSIELPPLAHGSEELVGCLVPASYRSTWTLYRGPSRRLLPELLRRLPAVEVFCHDSLHTRRNMLFEFNAVLTGRRGRLLLISDDVDANGAFAEVVRRYRAAYWAVVQEANKASCCGIAIFQCPPGLT